MKNWKTTISGIASIASGVALYLNQPDKIQEAIGLVVVGFGLLFSKDHNVTGGNVQSLGGSNPPTKKDER